MVEPERIIQGISFKVGDPISIEMITKIEEKFLCMQNLIKNLENITKHAQDKLKVIANKGREYRDKYKTALKSLDEEKNNKVNKENQTVLDIQEYTYNLEELQQKFIESRQKTIISKTQLKQSEMQFNNYIKNKDVEYDENTVGEPDDNYETILSKHLLMLKEYRELQKNTVDYLESFDNLIDELKADDNYGKNIIKIANLYYNRHWKSNKQSESTLNILNDYEKNYQSLDVSDYPDEDLDSIHEES